MWRAMAIGIDWPPTGAGQRRLRLRHRRILMSRDYLPFLEAEAAQFAELHGQMAGLVHPSSYRRRNIMSAEATAAYDQRVTARQRDTVRRAPVA